MAWAFHWGLRGYQKDFRAASDNPKHRKGVEARLPILLNLLLRANPRLRTYVSVETIMEDTGYAKEAVAGAIGWLFEHGAIYNVPPEYRVGKEADLPDCKYVFQLTGVIRLGDKWVRYLLFSREDAEMMRDEWAKIGMRLPVDTDFLTAAPDVIWATGVQSTPDEGTGGSQSEPDAGSQSERKVLPDLVLPDLSSTILCAFGADKPPTAGEESNTQSPLSDQSSPVHKQNQPEDEDPLASIDASLLIRDKTSSSQAAKKPDISGHPLVRLFLEHNGRSTLTESQRKKFMAEVTYRTEEGTTATFGGNLLWMWDNVPGFDEFCRMRFDQMEHWPTKMKPEQQIAHLANVAKQDGAGGFLKWRNNNPSLCNVVEDEKAPVDPVLADLQIDYATALYSGDRDECARIEKLIYAHLDEVGIKR